MHVSCCRIYMQVNAQTHRAGLSLLSAGRLTCFLSHLRTCSHKLLSQFISFSTRNCVSLPCAFTRERCDTSSIIVTVQLHIGYSFSAVISLRVHASLKFSVIQVMWYSVLQQTNKSNWICLLRSAERSGLTGVAEAHPPMWKFIHQCQTRTTIPEQLEQGAHYQLCLWHREKRISSGCTYDSHEAPKTPSW